MNISEVEEFPCGEEELLIELRFKYLESAHLCNSFSGRQGLASCSRLWITLKRRVGNQMLNTYLPTTCLLLTIYLTHYFKLDHYDTRIMVGLTGEGGEISFLACLNIHTVADSIRDACDRQPVRVHV